MSSKMVHSSSITIPMIVPVRLKSPVIFLQLQPQLQLISINCILYMYTYTGKGIGVTAVNIWYYHIVSVSPRQTQSYGHILGIPIAAIFAIAHLIVPLHTVYIPITETIVCISTFEDLYPHSRYIHHYLTPTCLHPSHGYKHTVVKHTPIADITSEWIYK